MEKENIISTEYVKQLKNHYESVLKEIPTEEIVSSRINCVVNEALIIKTLFTKKLKKKDKNYNIMIPEFKSLIAELKYCRDQELSDNPMFFEILDEMYRINDDLFMITNIDFFTTINEHKKTKVDNMDVLILELLQSNDKIAFMNLFNNTQEIFPFLDTLYVIKRNVIFWENISRFTIPVSHYHSFFGCDQCLEFINKIFLKINYIKNVEKIFENAKYYCQERINDSRLYFDKLDMKEKMIMQILIYIHEVPMYNILKDAQILSKIDPKDYEINKIVSNLKYFKMCIKMKFYYNDKCANEYFRRFNIFLRFLNTVKKGRNFGLLISGMKNISNIVNNELVQKNSSIVNMLEYIKKRDNLESKILNNYEIYVNIPNKDYIGLTVKTDKEIPYTIITFIPDCNIQQIVHELLHNFIILSNKIKKGGTLEHLIIYNYQLDFTILFENKKDLFYVGEERDYPNNEKFVSNKY